MGKGHRRTWDAIRWRFRESPASPLVSPSGDVDRKSQWVFTGSALSVLLKKVVTLQVSWL